MPDKRVIVIGGGSAGMVAAITAARADTAVVVLERMARVGKKLLATGNGRCNLTNTGIDCSRYHGEQPLFARPALERFGLQETLSFFTDLGIAPHEEEAGKIFPRSGQASAVLDVLRHELARLGVATHCEVEVKRLVRRDGGWEAITPGGVFRGAAVVLASGGKAAPQLGSNGSGYDLVLPFGHRLVEPFPALTRVRVRSPFLKHIKGVKINAEATLTGDQTRLQRAAGEVLFTETGLSGPPILDLSRRAGECRRRLERTWIVLDLCPDIPAAELPGILRDRFSRRDETTAEFALVGFLHKRLIAVALREAGVVDPGRPAQALTDDAAYRLAGVLKGWRLEVSGTDSWTEAQVTAGGIATAGIDPGTLESRKVAGLFFAGEVLDIDGDCGGFNLQWAWSSGRLAGKQAAAVIAGRRDAPRF